MRIIIKENQTEAGKWAASYIADKIKKADPSREKPFVLGLPTGSSPLPVYKEFIRMFKAGEISFKNVITFNMDEYVGLEENHTESYHYFMFDNLFNHIDVPRENINILNGNVKDLERECADYEKKIVMAGGIDLFLGGIGSDGHIAFNEPGSSLTSRTRIKSLRYDTILANSRFFGGDITRVPKQALTVGVGTIMDAREVLIIISGYNKARALREVVEGSISHMWTASILQMHQRGLIVCDQPSTSELHVETIKYFLDIENSNYENRQL
jgi:glucosamine-6-phosphate deaminase